MDQTLPKGWFLKGILTWMSVIGSLTVYAMSTRFSGGARNYIWAVVIPVSWIVAITIFFGLIGRMAPLPVPLEIFIATGMLPYLIFRQIVTSMLRCERAHRHLIIARLGTSDDIFNAAAMLEAVSAVLITIVTLVFVSLLSPLPRPESLLMVIAGFTLAWALGVSFGRFCAVLARHFLTIPRLVPILLRPLFWISGIFFLASELPTPIANILWWNPLLHCIEILRDGYFASFHASTTSVFVPLAYIAVFYFGAKLIDAGVYSSSNTAVLTS
jgi:capsular polysaccharide transport system permease protein